MLSEKGSYILLTVTHVEKVILLRVKDFKKRGRWISMVVTLSDLIDLVSMSRIKHFSVTTLQDISNSQQDNGIRTTSFTERLSNHSRSAGNICSPMSANLSFISNATQRYPLEWSIQSTSD